MVRGGGVRDLKPFFSLPMQISAAAFRHENNHHYGTNPKRSFGRASASHFREGDYGWKFEGWRGTPKRGASPKSSSAADIWSAAVSDLALVH